jgi:hypothetical protein
VARRLTPFNVTGLAAAGEEEKSGSNLICCAAAKEIARTIATRENSRIADRIFISLDVKVQLHQGHARPEERFSPGNDENGRSRPGTVVGRNFAFIR